MTQEKEIEKILSIVGCVIDCDIDRNYGDRDVYIHRLILAWNAFTDNALDETPDEYMWRKNNGSNIR